MLTPADAQLARRDPALPGLATLLDTDQLLQLLRPELSLNWQHLKLTQNYIRYKPGTSCLVGFSGTYQQQAIRLYARSHPPSERAKAAKPLLRPLLDSLLGPGGLLLETSCLLVMIFPNDHELRGLRDLHDPCRRNRALSMLLAHPLDFTDSEMTILRYKPERRCVGLIRTDSDHAFLIKAHARSFPLHAATGAQNFQHDSELQLRPRLGSLPHRGLALYPWVPGAPLGNEASSEQLRRLGRQLARLHGINAVHPAAAADQAGAAPTATLRGTLAAIAAIAPEQLAKAEELAERIQHLWHQQPAELSGIRCRIHGDFSGDQVIIQGDQTCLIDFDRSTISHPIDDLGSFLARLHQEQIDGKRSAAALHADSQALIEGYNAASCWPLADLVRPSLGLHLLQLAPEAFRLRRPDWPQRLDRVLIRVDRILAGEGEAHAA